VLDMSLWISDMLNNWFNKY